MKGAVSLFLGIAAGVLLLLANSAQLASIPVAGTMRVAETTFAGNGRLWIAAAFLAVALLGRLIRSRSLSLACAGITVGLLTDLCISAWHWRAEKLELLADLGSSGLVALIEWRPGAYLLAAGIAFALAFLIWEIYLETRKTRTD